MVRKSPTPVRFDADVANRLASFTAAHPGLSLSSAANLLVAEGLRMADHPGVVFRDGPTGRRAALAGGPDVWEVVRAVKSARLQTSSGIGILLFRVARGLSSPWRAIHTGAGYP